MVGIHGEIMENERENLHQLTEARDEVFALVLHNFSMDSHHSFSIMGNIVFLTYMHNYIPQIETDKKSGPSKGKKYDFAMKFFASHGLGGCHHPIFLSCTYVARCVWGSCEESTSKDAVFVENGGLEGMRVPRLVLKKRELQDTDNAGRSYGDRR
jgi:hypothetical protein